MNVNDLYLRLKKEVERGHGDLPIMVSGDGEVLAARRIDGFAKPLNGLPAKMLRRKYRKNQKNTRVELFGPASEASWKAAKKSGKLYPKEKEINE